MRHGECCVRPQGAMSPDEREAENPEVLAMVDRISGHVRHDLTEAERLAFAMIMGKLLEREPQAFRLLVEYSAEDVFWVPYDPEKVFT